MKSETLIAVLVMAVLAMPIEVLAAPPVPAHHRTAQEIRSDTQWAAQHAVSELKANGLQGLVDDITKCYDTTMMPAFRCVYLDVAAWSIDSSMGKSLGLNGPTKEYFASQAINGRLAPQMTAQGLSEAQVKAQIVATISLMQNAVDAEFAVQTLAGK